MSSTVLPISVHFAVDRIIELLLRVVDAHLYKRPENLMAPRNRFRSAQQQNVRKPEENNEMCWALTREINE